jgi:hypothetical protein
MHLIATYLFDWIDWALRTSEKVPSPFLLISRYSKIEFVINEQPRNELTNVSINKMTYCACLIYL